METSEEFNLRMRRLTTERYFPNLNNIIFKIVGVKVDVDDYTHEQVMEMINGKRNINE